MIPQNSEELSQIFANPKNTLFLFYFTMIGCPACNKIKKLMTEIENQYPKICFVNLDTNQFPDIAKDNKIEYIPVISNKKVVWATKQIIGFKKDAILELLIKYK